MSVGKQLYWGTVTYEDWTLYLLATDKGLARVTWPNQSFAEVVSWAEQHLPSSMRVHEPNRMERYSQALLRYLNDHTAVHDHFEFDLHGTEFQCDVWQALRRIPYGQTVTYSDIAAKINRSGAVRAVAGAISANPIAFLVPCHRVIGKDGSLTGYRGGVPLKERLLRQEGSVG